MPAVLTAILSLLLFGGTATRARADDAPSAGAATAAPDPRDLNGDGVVTGKERRQYRRAHRKKGTTTDDSADAGPSPDAAADAQAHSAAAGAKASAAASALKSSLVNPDAIGGAGGPGAPGAAAKGGAPNGAAAGPGAKPSGDPSNPAAPSDFVLAARSGYAPAFATAGLRLAPDGSSIVRADGSPATADDYARLRGAILQLPAALGRRPDFFSAISPAHFSDLKESYRGDPGPGDPAYKHVGTTAGDRDFVHTESCAKMSGECNENAEKSYKKGDYVAPEDLDRMWDSLQKEVDNSESENENGLSVHHGSAMSASADATQSPDAKDGGTAGGGSTAGAKASASGGKSASPISVAAQVARGFLHATRAMLGLGSSSSDAPGSGPLEIGALSAAVLAALVFALRRKL